MSAPTVAASVSAPAPVPSAQDPVTTGVVALPAAAATSANAEHPPSEKKKKVGGGGKKRGAPKAPADGAKRKEGVPKTKRAASLTHMEGMTKPACSRIFRRSEMMSDKRLSSGTLPMMQQVMAVINQRLWEEALAHAHADKGRKTIYPGDMLKSARTVVPTSALILKFVPKKA